MSLGPIYTAGLAAGLDAAAAYLDGRAAMARESGRRAEGEALDAARVGLLRLKPAQLVAPEGEGAA